jgi:co-chaperonin GroES (HSP10)
MKISLDAPEGHGLKENLVQKAIFTAENMGVTAANWQNLLQSFWSTISRAAAKSNFQTRRRKVAKTIIPLGKHVMVIDKPEETVIEGIELPSNVKQQDMTFGMVVSVGKEAPKEFKVRDIVVYGPYAGKTVLIGGSEFRILKYDAIEGFVGEDDEPSKANV